MKSISNMKKNIGDVDIMIRLLAAIVFADLAADQASIGHWNIPFWVLAFFLAASGITGWCPLYALFHWHTNSRDHQPQ